MTSGGARGSCTPEKPKYQKPRYPAICEYCGKTYQIYAALLRDMPSRPKQRFCSRSCSSKGGTEARAVPAEERFWSKVDKNGPVPECRPDLGPCWIWLGAASDNGYGAFKNGDRDVGAHRFSYELHKGPIGPGLEPDHLCRVRLCVNPSHLETVTHLENVRRGESPAMRIQRSGHCSHGHEMTLENAVAQRDGKRGCRACNRINARRNLFRKKYGRNPNESEINSPQNLYAWRNAMNDGERQQLVIEPVAIE